jgi:TonB family protein
MFPSSTGEAADTMKYLAAIFLLLPMAALAQSPPPVATSHGACPAAHHRFIKPECPTGPTRLSFRIEPDGSVAGVTVDQSSGSAWLDEQAATCAASWIYKPAIQNGKPVEVPWRAEVAWHSTSPSCAPYGDMPPPKPAQGN